MPLRRSLRPSRPRRWAFPWRRLLYAALLLALFGAVTLSVAWIRICDNGACPAISDLDNYDPEQATRVWSADGQLITTIGDSRRTLVTLADLPPAVTAAFLAVEDKRFYQHQGVDWIRLFGALKTNLIHLSPTRQGFSTITMQLAGNIWTDYIDRRQDRGLDAIRRKLREVKVALEIERKYPKDKILELYLNQISLGGGASGVEAAAQRYFGKEAAQLNVAEAASLAALPKSPRYFDPRVWPGNAVERRNLVLELMRDVGYLTTDDAERWKGYPVLLSTRPDYSEVGQYFVEYVRLLAKSHPWGDNLMHSGLNIYTTLDIGVQMAAEQAMADQLSRIENGQVRGRFPHQTYSDYLQKRAGASADSTPYLQGAALVLEAKTGKILAMVGGRDFDDSKFNRITLAARQPGSTFKPIVYSAALEAGMTMEDREVDERFAIDMPDGQPPYSPVNYEPGFSDSALTMRTAVARSVNTVAVKFGMKVGIPAILEEARRFGISARIDPVPSIILGAATVKPMEMIAAYTTFANLGKRTVPYAIVEVLDKNGKVLYRPTPKPPIEVMEPSLAYAMHTGLRAVVTSGSGNRAVWQAGFQIPSGGKTGTTSNLWDTWYIGYTPDIVAGVWIGFDNPKSIMPGAQGGLLAAPAWTQMMLDIYRRRPAPADWTVPQQEMVSVEIDRSNGFRATPYCPDEFREVRTFVKGTEPKEFCPVHSPFQSGTGGTSTGTGGGGGGGGGGGPH